MTVYELVADSNHFKNLVVDPERDWQRFDGFDGRAIRGRWMPVRVHEPRDEPQRLPAGDFPSLLRAVPVFTERARAILHPLIGNCGEWLPLSSNEGEYWAFNVLDVRDALDHDRSEIERFSHGGVMRVAGYGAIIESCG